MPIAATSTMHSRTTSSYPCPTGAPTSESPSPTHEVDGVVTSCAPSFNGWGVTAMDSLDTMLLMGLEDEYTRALPMISHTNFSLPSVSPLLLPFSLRGVIQHQSLE